MSLALAEKGRQTIAASLLKLVDKGKMSAPDREAVLERIVAVADLAGLAAAQMVVEAASEDPVLKCAVLKKLDNVMPAAAILAAIRRLFPSRGLARPLCALIKLLACIL